MTEYPPNALIKITLRNDIHFILYDPIYKQLTVQINALILKNTVSCGYSHLSFKFNNRLYECDKTKAPRKTNHLTLSLYPAMYAYLDIVTQLDKKELPIVMGYINQVLNISNDPDDYAYLLPETFISLIYNRIPRYPDKSDKLLSPLTITLRNKNQVALDMIKQRLVSNLLI